MKIDTKNYTLNLNKIFPFFLILDKTLKIIDAGNSLLKLFPNILNTDFESIFKIKRPWNVKCDYNSIIKFSQQLYIIESNDNVISLRYQLSTIENSDNLLFVGTPWVTSSEELQNLNLYIDDFAIHDILPDIFQFLKVSEINSQDIKILAQELSEQKKLLKQVIDLFPYKVFLKDLNHRYILVNKRVEEIFKKGSEYILGKTFQELYGKNDIVCNDILKDLEVMQNRNKIEYLCESPFQITPGIVRTNHVIKMPYEVNGELYGVLELAIDVTESLVSDKKLNESEEKYRTIIENASDIIYQTNFNGHFTYINHISEKITGYTKEELLKMSHLDLIKPEYRAATEAFYLSDAFLKNHSSIFYEVPLISKSGKEIWINQKVTPIIRNERVVGYQSVARDISQIKVLEFERIKTEKSLKETAYRLKSLVENLNIGVIVVDENQKILAVNDEFCKTINLNISSIELIGVNFSEIEHHLISLCKNQEKFINRVNNIYKSKKIVIDEEVELITNKILEINFNPIFVQNEYKGHLWTYRDVTARKFEQVELIKAKEAAVQSSLVKEQFLSTMSHEIRTPMNAVIGMTQLLISKEPKEDQVEYLEAIKYSADNLLCLINDILDYTKLESGKVEIENVDFDLYDLVKKNQKIFNFQAKSKKVKFNFVIYPDVTQYLKGDTFRLNQILNNLFSNALKFTEKGSIKIEVYNTPQKINHITFKVSDTGIGIESSKLDKIFERFTQANSDTTRKYGGTGLGLSITKLIIDLLGGTVKVESIVGLGTIFYIDLPFSIGNPLNIPEKKLKLNELGVNFLGKKVLLVEDNQLNQVIANEFLKSWNIEVFIEDNGQKAINFLKNNPEIDLILMDLQMPIMDGYTTTKMIRENSNSKIKNIPIIALSASNSIGIIKKAKECGVDDYLTKPFEYQSLFNKISEYINNKSKSETNLFEIIPQKKVYNLSYYEEVLHNNNNLIKEMVLIYLKETPIVLNNLNEAINNKSYEEIFNASHKLATSFTMLGIDYEKVKQLEEYSFNKNCEFNILEDLNNQVQKIGKISIEELNNYLKTI